MSPDDTNRVVVFAGVHGNEESGMVALSELSRRGFVTYGPCNPWGWESRGRYTKRARDLNRAFLVDDCAEAEAVRQFLAGQQPALVMDLHEDPRASGPFLIQISPGYDIGRRLRAALARHNRLEERPRLGLTTGADGLVSPLEAELEATMTRQGWSLAYYAWRRHGCPALVVEAPGAWSLESKVALHLEACEEARAFLG